MTLKQAGRARTWLSRLPSPAARGCLLFLAVALSPLFLHPVSAQETAEVAVGDFFFCDSSTEAGECVTRVTAGDTVRWLYEEGTAGHTVTACGESCDAPTDNPAFDSGRLLTGESYSFTFQSAGTYLYYCEFHPVAMRGSIVVQAATPAPTEEPTPVETSTPTQPPTATPTDDPTPGPTPTPRDTVTPSAAPTPSPAEDESDGGGGLSLLWFILGGTAIAGVLAAAGAIFFNLRRTGS